MKQVDIVIIGGGPAGLAAASAAKEAGIENILILERDTSLGGILNQCIHNGFGLHTFSEELSGPEYAARYIKKVEELNIPVLMQTMVIEITRDKKIVAVNQEGILTIQAKAIILAMGCRERSRGALNIPGSRAIGVYSAGTAQKFVNIDGYIPGKEVVILGSGDIGLVMARRMSFEGAKVKAVIEIQPYSSGLNRNIVQCLDDFNIPLKLSHSIINIKGNERVEGVTISKVDDKWNPIKGTEEFISCDTVLFSVGLMPENELSEQADVNLSKLTNGPIVNESFQTNQDGIFACGNVLHVHDLVDFVSEESRLAGISAAKYVKGLIKEDEVINVNTEGGIRYAVPQYVRGKNVDEKITLRYRVNNVYKNKYVSVYFDDVQINKRKKLVQIPSEMESVDIKKEVFDKYPNTKKITIKLEEV